MRFKNFLLTAIKFILSLVFLIAVAILAWALLTSMVKVFGEQTESVDSTIVVAIISGLGAIIVNAISKSSERKSQLFMKSKEKMVVVYETFLDELNNVTSEEQAKAVFEKSQGIFAVNSSDETYQEFLALKENYFSTKNTDRLIVAIRKELKVSNKKNPEQKEVK